jgi:hypothetical protein
MPFGLMFIRCAESTAIRQDSHIGEAFAPIPLEGEFLYNNALSLSCRELLC